MTEFKNGDRVIAEKRRRFPRKGTVVDVKLMSSGDIAVTITPDWYEGTTSHDMLYRDSDLRHIDVIDQLAELVDE